MTLLALALALALVQSTSAVNSTLDEGSTASSNRTFAVLVDSSAYSSPALAVASTVCSTFSIVTCVLVLIIYAFICNQNNLRSVPVRLLVALAASILAGKAPLSTASMNGDSAAIATPAGGCFFTGLALHYFLLVQFCVSLVHAGKIYTAMVRLEDARPGKARHLLAVCLVVPAVIVLTYIIVYAAAASGSASRAYGTHETPGVCFIASQLGLILSFLVPALLIMIFNTIVLVLMMRSVLRLQRNSRQRKQKRSTESLAAAGTAPPSSTDRSRLQLFRDHLKVCFTLFLLLSLPWLLGILVVLAPQNAFSAWLFVLTVTLQGVFIAFNFVRNSKIRQALSTAVSTFRPSMRRRRQRMHDLRERGRHERQSRRRHSTQLMAELQLQPNPHQQQQQRYGGRKSAFFSYFYTRGGSFSLRSLRGSRMSEDGGGVFASPVVAHPAVPRQPRDSSSAEGTSTIAGGTSAASRQSSSTSDNSVRVQQQQQQQQEQEETSTHGIGAWWFKSRRRRSSASSQSSSSSSTHHGLLVAGAPVPAAVARTRMTVGFCESPVLRRSEPFMMENPLMIMKGHERSLSRRLRELDNCPSLGAIEEATLEHSRVTTTTVKDEESNEQRVSSHVSSRVQSLLLDTTCPLPSLDRLASMNEQSLVDQPSQQHQQQRQHNMSSWSRRAPSLDVLSQCAPSLDALSQHSFHNTNKSVSMRCVPSLDALSLAHERGTPMQSSIPPALTPLSARPFTPLFRNIVPLELTPLHEHPGLPLFTAQQTPDASVPALTPLQPLHNVQYASRASTHSSSVASSTSGKSPTSLWASALTLHRLQLVQWDVDGVVDESEAEAKAEVARESESVVMEHGSVEMEDIGRNNESKMEFEDCGEIEVLEEEMGEEEHSSRWTHDEDQISLPDLENLSFNLAPAQQQQQRHKLPLSQLTLTRRHVERLQPSITNDSFV